MKKSITLYMLSIIAVAFSLFLSLKTILSLDFEGIRLSPGDGGIFSTGTNFGLLEYIYLSIILILIILLVIKAIRNFKENNYILFLLAIPPLVLLFSEYFPIENFMEKIILYLFVVSIILYPLTLSIKSIKNKTYNLLTYLVLLIEWDTVITWIHLRAFSLEELNPFINTENLAIFFIQKFLPFFLFVLTYLLVRNKKKNLITFNKVLTFACIAYGLLFIWQLYVAYLFNQDLLLMLPVGIISLSYFTYNSLKKGKN